MFSRELDIESNISSIFEPRLALVAYRKGPCFVLSLSANV
jgi:hypothetical protein